LVLLHRISPTNDGVRRLAARAAARHRGQRRRQTIHRRSGAVCTSARVFHRSRNIGEAQLAREIARFRDIRVRWPWRPPKVKYPPARLRCRCAPLYEPAWCNDGGQKQLRNNCYNYGSNYRTDTFHQIPGGSQPGAAAGAMYASITGPDVRNAAIADGLINNSNANNKCPSEGHLVALVIAPGFDFHWYRKGRTGIVKLRVMPRNLPPTRRAPNRSRPQQLAGQGTNFSST
jgi:hypothetical protein